MDLLGRNVFEKADGITATEEWLEKVGMRLRLRDLGCELEHAEDIAKITVQTFRNLRLHPRTQKNPEKAVPAGLLVTPRRKAGISGVVEGIRSEAETVLA